MFLTFHDLESRFGSIAYEYLREIEKAAGLVPNQAIDPETRLAKALRTQDADLMRRAA